MYLRQDNIIRTHWCAALLGAVVTTLEFVTSHGEKGSAIAYKPAACSYHVAYATAGFESIHPTITTMLKALTTRSSHAVAGIGGRRCRKWTWLSSLDEVKTRAAKLDNRAWELLVFVSEKEFRSPPEQLKGVRHILTERLGRAWATTIDESRSFMGVSGY